MKHIDLDRENQQVKQFVLSLTLDADDSLLELDGKPVARVVPVAGATGSCDPEKLKAAIIARRDESRRLNDEWQYADNDAWTDLPPDQS